MNLIQCASNCVYQKDGYCGLETVSPVNSINTECPHFKENKKSLNKRKCFANTSNADKFHRIGR